MLSFSVNDSSYPGDQSKQLNITRIEVFVIPALAVDSAGYRVCLRLTSNLGYGWSEQFVYESDTSFHLNRWNQLLRTFIGSFSLSSLIERLAERIAATVNPEHRAYNLFSVAVHGLLQQIGQSTTVTSDSNSAEESVLQQRAVFYLSLD
ncbi:hypothetical protein I6N90_05935 [Paenibacillus sp. GSMTC-2017]|uniref:hypothetical protein n=1 Tax=Paenibacillus sp. GSMTC-2017 TaxID=2794350 RepID=UPI0018D9343E|nr:hypothetical protein [Paenibacillus sp. GSMTC-2017]MBH5317352.1 hypothetical protein [Paenibacillus sp. GSMTC-2017]